MHDFRRSFAVFQIPFSHQHDVSEEDKNDGVRHHIHPELRYGSIVELVDFLAQRQLLGSWRQQIISVLFLVAAQNFWFLTEKETETTQTFHVTTTMRRINALTTKGHDDINRGKYLQRVILRETGKQLLN